MGPAPLWRLRSSGSLIKTRIVALLTTLGLLKSRREPVGDPAPHPRAAGHAAAGDGSVRVTANGRGDWIGWLELKREAVDEDATRNTARVVGDMAADVLAVIEAEDRPALQRFNEDVLPFGFAQGAPAWRYRHVDADRRQRRPRHRRRPAHPRPASQSRGMRSHVDDLAPNGEGLFSRDCPEYELALRRRQVAARARQPLHSRAIRHAGASLNARRLSPGRRAPRRDLRRPRKRLQPTSRSSAIGRTRQRAAPACAASWRTARPGGHRVSTPQFARTGGIPRHEAAAAHAANELGLRRSSPPRCSRQVHAKSGNLRNPVVWRSLLARDARVRRHRQRHQGPNAPLYATTPASRGDLVDLTEHGLAAWPGHR